MTAKCRDGKKEVLPGKIFVISGPSGSGKTTLVKRLLRDRSLRKILVHSISLTTRHKRSKERNKKDYFFITEKQFNEERKAKKILEWTRYLGYYYATPKDFVENQLKYGGNVILCLDLAGARKIKKLYPRNTRTIFVEPPSIDVLHSRIRNRCHKTAHEEISQRLGLAQQEISSARQYDYSLVNQDLDLGVQELKRIIVENIKKEGKHGLCANRKIIG